MFGYVRAFAPELKVKEHNLYRAVYCGLCKSLGKHCGQCLRFTLSYDMVFLTAFRLSAEKTPYSVKNEHCIVHPFKKRPVMTQNPVLEYCAKASAVLSYGKSLDSAADEKGIKKAMYTAVLPFFGKAAKRADMPDICDKMNMLLAELSHIEKEKTPSVDIPAEVFGRITAEIFSFGLDGSERLIAEKVGFHTGKWIYAADAVDDLKRDASDGSYNPFLLVFGEKITPECAETIKSAFFSELCEIEKALDLMDFADSSLKAIVYNTVCEGMRQKSIEIADNAVKNAENDDKGAKN